MRWVDFLTTDFRKVAAETRKQRMEKANIMPPDESDVLHTFPSGHTIRRLTTNRDRYREGCLQGICWAPNNNPDGRTTDPAKFPKQRELLPEITGESRKFHLSLRDPDNLPLASFYMHTPDDKGETHLKEIEGRKNSHVKPEYVDMIGAWHYHAAPHKAGTMEFHVDPEHPSPAPGVRDTGYGYWGEGGRQNEQKYLMKTYESKDLKNMYPQQQGHVWKPGDEVAITDPGGKVLDAFGRVTEHAPKKGIYKIHSPLFGKLEASHEEMANQTDDVLKFHPSPYKYVDRSQPGKIDVPDTLPQNWAAKLAFARWGEYTPEEN